MLSSVGTADNNPPIQVDSFEAKWAEQNALKKLKKDIGLFGRTMFPTALNKDIPHSIMRFINPWLMSL